jgi:hypothetical protein
MGNMHTMADWIAYAFAATILDRTPPGALPIAFFIRVRVLSNSANLERINRIADVQNSGSHEKRLKRYRWGVLEGANQCQL